MFASDTANESENATHETTSLATLEKKVATISTEISDGISVQIGQKLSLAARPVDKAGEVIDGIAPKWSCGRSDVVRIINGSEAIAVGEGTARLVVHTESSEKVFNIRVVKNSKDSTSVSSLYDIPEVPELDEDFAESLVTPENNLGSPVGQTEMGSSSFRAAAKTRERYGSSNYSFGVPVASLPGRGIDASIGITYNSRVWNKRVSGGNNVFDFNPNNNWLSPGFEIGFGELISYGTGSGGNGIAYMLTSPDGTRHQLRYKQASGGCSIYESDDGTFIQTTICGIYTTSTMNVVYPDGTQVMYGATTTSGKRFPVRITDRNGNMLTIAYVTNDSQGKILYVRDTLNRYINFYYEPSGDKRLIAVTVPGFDGGSARQTIRFYYDELTLLTSGRFESPAQVNAPATVNVLKYVYFPGTGAGYKYEYSPYFGTIYKISQLRGMTVSTTSTTSTGSVTSEGTEAAWTQYNYPVIAMDLGAPLTDVPKYSWRKDDWLGRDGGSPPQTNFQSVEDVTTVNGLKVGTRTVTVTSPDGTKNISVSKVNQSQWDDGLLLETRLVTIESSQERVWSKTKMFWQQGSGSPPGRANPRLQKIEVTNDAGQTRATSFEYDAYNNQTVVKEHDYDNPGELGTELRRTETTYETGSGWVNNRLLRLPKTVRTIVNSVTVSKVAFEYDNNGATLNTSNIQYRENLYDLFVHDARYNPSSPSGEDCMPDCEPPIMRCCWEVPVYQTETRYRGNVTKITAFSDATLTTDTNASVSTIKYDVTGNVVESSSSCCELTEIEYGAYYAYPISTTRNGQSLEMTTSATYDLNTGLVKTVTDQNNQTTEVTYDPDSLRVVETEAPNGAVAAMEYNDSTYPYHVKQTVDLDDTRTVSSWSFSNGAGQTFRSRSQTSGGYFSSDVEFDVMGRPVRRYNPYKVTSLGDARPGGIKFTEVTELDGLGRAIETTFQDDTTVTVEYDGMVVTTTDQAGKKRRQIADALGRIVRVDEPNSAGQLGSVSSPNQPTYYEYDGNGNLTKVTQSDGTSTQERLFKYDSLSRLTHERQVEASPTLDNAGAAGSPSPSKWTGVYKYNTDSLLVEGYDANGVKTAFTYDGLNRISTVVYTGESGYQTPTVTYTYDETESGFFNKGRLTKVETAANGTYGIPATVQNYRYDKMGQVTKHTQSIGSEVFEQQYGYNLAGQMVSQTYPSGRVVETTIDNYGMIAGVEDEERRYLTGIELNAQGMVAEITLGNGASETFTYNDRFQLTSQSIVRDSVIQQKYDYSYGTVDLGTGTVDAAKNNGQLSKIEGFIGANKQWSQRLAYDELGRLKEAREYKQGDNGQLTYKQVFDFDRFGNKYRKAANNPTGGQANPLPFTPIEDNDIDRATNRFASDITYNAKGEVIEDERFRDMGFAYDANGRQVRATKTSQPDAETVYDSLGNRVATKVNDEWRFLIYDAFGRLVAEYGEDEPDITAGLKYVHKDWQGSVRAVTNRNGYIVARTDHQAFGETIGAGVGARNTSQGYLPDKALRQSYGLTESDEGSGQQHTWFRKLETQAGRWSSPDPYKGSMSLGDPQSFNRYTYVTNDPINFIDPSGLMMMCFGYNVYIETYEDGRLMGTRYIGFIATHCWDDGSSYSYGGGGGGTESSSVDEKQYLICMNAVERKYGNPKPPDNYNDFLTKRRQVEELMQLKFSQNWSLSAFEIGVLVVLAKTMGKTGIAVGVVSKVVATIWKDSQTQDEWILRVRHLGENYPEAMEHYMSMVRKEAAQKDCEKYLPKDERSS